MPIAIQQIKESSLVLMEGRIEASDCLLLEDVLQAASFSNTKCIWVDCEHIVSVSTAALRAMLSLSRKAKSEGVHLLFYEMAPSVKKALKESGPDAGLHIVASIADASHYCEGKTIPEFIPPLSARKDKF
ncbi:STAS domain-containing protein [Pontibacter toksunensis]|uniref:STAS domain-containing protein n=1 Tax=Pontibacter toksunensis TaxID=1332631 RepID=A0ABW6C0Y8_9BACT